MFQSPPTSHSSKKDCQVDPNKGADISCLKNTTGVLQLSVGRWKNGKNGASINGGSQTWMVFLVENLSKMDDLGVPLC